MRHLLILNIPPELEDEMVDYLLSLKDAGGFTSYPVRGHGEHQYLSIAEQVSGRRKRVQFELILPEAATSTVLGGLKEQVGTDIFYWQQPVAASGRL